MALFTLVACGNNPSAGDDPVDGGDTQDPDAACSNCPDPTEAVFDPNHIIDVAVIMDPADFEEMRNQIKGSGSSCTPGVPANLYTYFPATVTVDGELVENVGVRNKGGGSRSVEKPSIKIKFSEYMQGQRYKTMKRMTFNNTSKTDPSYVKQCLGYQLFAAAGVPAPRCNFARVSVNGTDFGIYTHVENVKKRFLRRHFADDSGNLYEGTGSDFRAQWVDRFELKTNKTTADRSDLDAVARALEAPNASLLQELSPLIDVDKVITHLAMEVLIHHWDSVAVLLGFWLRPQPGLILKESVARPTPVYENGLVTFGRLVSGLAIVLATAGTLGCGSNPGNPIDAGPQDSNAAVDGGDSGSLSDPFYDPASIVDVKLTIAASDLAALDANPFAEVYVPATFEAMGVDFPSVGVRYKGNSSLARAGNKPSIKIKINEFETAQRFLGLTKVNLNNSVLDPSMQREFLAYELFRAFAVPASRANYARLTINGEYYGLYINVEQVDKRMLSRVFGDNDGNLYKQYSQASLESRGTNPAAYNDGTYRKKTNEIEDDWTDLIALTDLLTNADSATLETQLPQLFDVSGFLRWLAVNTYLSHIDAYTGFANNYYLYRNPADDRFVYIPWDLDITFGTQGHGGTTDAFLLDWDLYDPQIPTPTGPRPLLTRVLSTPAFRAEYTGYLVELVDGGAVGSALSSRITEVRSMINAAALADARKPYSNDEFTNSLTVGVPAPGDTLPVIGIARFVEERTPIVSAQLP